MSVSSLSGDEDTIMEGFADVPEDITITTLTSEMLKGNCIENERVRIFFVSGFFTNDDYAVAAKAGQCTEPKHIFGGLASKIVWCSVNIEENENGTIHFHAVVELSTPSQTHAILRHMRKAGCTVNTQSEGLFKHSFVKKDRPKGRNPPLPWLKDISNIIWYCQKDKTRLHHFEFGTFFGMTPTEAMKDIRKNKLKGKKLSKNKKKGDSNTVDDAIEILQPYLDQLRHFDGPSDIRDKLFQEGHSAVLLKHGNKIDEMVLTYKQLRFPRQQRTNQGWFAWYGAPECGKTFGVNEWSRFMVADALGESWNDDDIPLRSIVHRFNMKETKTSYQNEPILQCEEFFGDCLKLNDFKEINPIGSDDHTFSMPVKYKIEQAVFNHIAMAITSNNWPLDWYHGVFSGPNGDIEYQAFMRRCGGLYFFPKYRITDEDDPTSVEMCCGRPVINKVELDGTTLLRKAQWVDLTSVLRTETYKEACEVKIKWVDQLKTMSESEKARIRGELEPVDLTAQTQPWMFRQARTDRPIN